MKNLTSLSILIMLVYGVYFLYPAREGDIGRAIEKPGDSVRIAFYNIENLFDINRDGSEYELFVPSATGWNQYTYDNKLSNIAEAIKALGADIIGLCEIENRTALRDLKIALNRRGVPYMYSAIPVGGTSATYPALLSKYPIINSGSLDVKLPDGTTSRPILHAKVLIGEDTVVFFVNHWPSKYWPETYRIEAAKSLSGFLSTIPKNQDYVVLGDLNCNYDEWESMPGNHSNESGGLTSVNHILGTIKLRDASTVCYTSSREIKRLEHMDLWTDIDPRLRCSYVYRGQPQTPDHILMPSSLFDTLGFSYLHKSFDIFTWHGRLIWDDKPFRRKILYINQSRKHTTRGFSDHLPVSAIIYRGPFDDKKRKKDDISLCRNRYRCGFESGFEGWKANIGKLTCLLDTVAPFEGSYNARFCGELSRSSAIAAKGILVPGRGRVEMRWWMRGSGNIAARYRWNGNGWGYAQMSPFKLSSRSRYIFFESPQWCKLSLKTSIPPAQNSVLTIELRSKKGWVDISLDDVNFIFDH